ncbi:uracil-DNA glycosylase [Chitiniphilus eburneus]|uniref:Type-4 uracil-DNA glycosylase n=1 Tax=Chitiniphilus eburneus TaxID=2571148 RepID=A0A4U0QRJ3_9NEIS|nr:uracil-DNA glycosylase [Chitiniphilus eburneus]TJZ78844.1 uracil-DNA glycosylase [Chitiniphilus eburneus]
MSRRDLILSELGLTPLWVRPELLAEPEAVAEPEIAARIAPVADDAPPPPVRREAPVIVVPHTQPERAPSAPAPTAAPVRPAAPPPRGNGGPSVHATIAPLAEADSSRARDIAAMDWATLQQAVTGCTACGLCKTRTHAVFGVGNPQAELLVVGEAPGAEEDRQGEPFVGAAGKLLDNMLAAIGEKRGERVFIANVLKCRPPGNRNPQPEEVLQCAPLLARQIELIRPRLIFAIGRFAIQTLLQTDAPVGALRGKLHQVNDIPVVVGYHPAYLLRNLPDKARAWRDLLLVQQRLQALTAASRD